MNRQFIVRDGVFLWSKPKGPVVLCLNGLSYQPVDQVPDGLLTGWKEPLGLTAANFVSEIMRGRFGDDRAQWPELANEFCQLCS